MGTARHRLQKADWRLERRPLKRSLAGALARGLKPGRILALPPRPRSAAFRLQKAGIILRYRQISMLASCSTLLQPKGCAPIRLSGVHAAWRRYQDAPLKSWMVPICFTFGAGSRILGGHDANTD